MKTRNSTRSAQRGVTLIELMVAVALGLVVITMVMRTYATTATNATTNAAVSEYQTNGRYALDVLKREIRHAALRPLVWNPVRVTATPDAEIKNYGCGAGLANNLFAGLQASNDSNPYAATCLQTGADRTYARGDVVTLRRTALEPTTGALVPGATYARLAYGQGRIFLGSEPVPDFPQPVFTYRIVNDVYFINDFSRSADEVPRVPALYRLTQSGGNNPVLVPELVASNVEHLQVQFGRQIDANGTMQYFDADDLTADQWLSVTTARIWLVVRASQPENGLASQSYTVGDVEYAPQDNFRRAVLTGTINLRNM
jgi:type IV pilus assembly protein PilW